MISYILGFFMLIAIAVTLSLYLDISVGRTFMAALLSVCILLYIFAIFSLTNIGYILIAFCSMVCVALCLARLKQTIEIIKTPPVIVLMTAVFLSSLVLPWLSGTDPQVMRYWLPGLEFIIETNAMPYGSTVLPQDILHPPLIWFLQYFLLFNSDIITIGLIFSANNLLAFACLLPIFEDAKPKNKFDVLLIVVGLVMVLSLLGIDSGFSTVSPGRLFAMLFGYGLYLSIFYRMDKPYAVTELCIVISGVCLINSTGFAFAFLILLMVRINTFFATKDKGLIKRAFAAAKQHMMSTVALATTSTSFVAVLLLSGNTTARAAVSSVFTALSDFVNWIPYTLTVLSLLLMPYLIKKVYTDENKKPTKE